LAKTAREVPRVKVIRHRAECPSKAEGKAYVRCACPKALYWYEGGKERIISADTSDYQEAERKAFQKQSSFEQIAKGEPEHITIAAAVDLYLASKKATGYEDKSLGKLELIFRDRFQTYFTQRGILYLKDVKRADLEAWRATWTGAASTKGKTQGRVIGFFDWAVKGEMIDKNPALGLERIKGARDVAPTMALSDEQFAKVLDTIEQLTHRDDEALDRLRALALLQRWSGLAIRDALTVERKEFTKQASGWYRLFLRRAKTGVEVYVSLAPAVAEEILGITPVSDRWLFWDGKEDRDSIVQRYGNAYRRVSALAELKDEHGNPLEFHSHMLRDTFAVWCFTQGMATEDVAALLGHRNITVTQEHYSPWIGLRQARLGSIVEAAYARWSAGAS
jgi:integrase/recombinase XerD